MSTCDEKEAEKDWARNRPGVKERWEFVDAGRSEITSKGGEVLSTYASDGRASFLGALLPSERRRAEDVLVEGDVEVADLSQEPNKRKRFVRAGEPFMTVIRQTGLMLRIDELRQSQGASASWVSSADVLAMSGFPITNAQVLAAGSPCIYSRQCQELSPPQRTAERQKKALGNAMHMAHVGGLMLVTLCKFPFLGAPEVASLATTPPPPGAASPAARFVATAEGPKGTQLSALAASPKKLRARGGEPAKRKPGGQTQSAPSAPPPPTMPLESVAAIEPDSKFLQAVRAVRRRRALSGCSGASEGAVATPTTAPKRLKTSNVASTEAHMASTDPETDSDKADSKFLQAVRRFQQRRS